MANVREHVLDVLTPEQVQQLTGIADALLERLLHPEGRMSSLYRGARSVEQCAGSSTRDGDAPDDLRRQGSMSPARMA